MSKHTRFDLCLSQYQLLFAGNDEVMTSMKPSSSFWKLFGPASAVGTLERVLAVHKFFPHM